MISTNDRVEFVAISQSNYDKLTTKTDSTFYFIYDTNSLYIGSICIICPPQIKDELFPIGKVEVFFDNEDHSNYLGFKWERCLIGRVPVGINPDDTDFNTIGKQIGEKEHKLTIDEMPSHIHTNKYGGTASGERVAVGWHSFTIDDANKAEGINPAGGDLPHNNIQPSEVVAFWKRIS